MTSCRKVMSPIHLPGESRVPTHPLVMTLAVAKTHMVNVPEDIVRQMDTELKHVG